MEENDKHSTIITTIFHNYQDILLILPLRRVLFQLRLQVNTNYCILELLLAQIPSNKI